MKEEIKKIMASVFMMDISKIPDDISQANFETWESLQHLMLMVNIESEFKVNFEPEEIVEMISIDEIEKHLKKKLGR